MSTSDDSAVHGDTTSATTGTAPSDSPLNTAPSSSTSSSSSSSSSTHSETPAESTSADQYPHHVIFVVHGMGRQLEEFGNYERNVSYLVENTKAVLQSQFHELKTDVHIIPIEWHAKLHSMVDERMALASLRTVPKVRLVMNDYFADILYYFNNHYGTEIIRMIVEELNEAYETFLAKHPDFNGKISVYALSLGGVAMFDILTCLDDDDEDSEQTETTGTETKAQDQDQDQNPSRPGAKDGQEPNKKRPRIRKQDQSKFRAVVPKLKFRPDYLFTVGSPVGAVMVMRNLDWDTFHPPDDIIHHNLFHPFDPLGYRIEPLIDPVFAGIPAVTMTNSLGAGRWLSGNSTGGNGLQEENGGASGNAVEGRETEEDREDNHSTENLTAADEDSSEVNDGHNPRRGAKNDRDAMIVDGDASVTEYMIAATTATYLDQGEGQSRPADSETYNDTTTGAPAQATSSSRRPSLGPRTISSRVEAGEDDRRQYQQTIPEATEDGSSPLAMEYYMGMEGGPTAEERARGLGAKSDVVQESMVRSLPSDSSCLPRSAKSPKDGNNPAENKNAPNCTDETVTEGESHKKQEGERARSESSSSPEAEAAAPASATKAPKAGKHSGSSRVVHVEGRPTKVPYRIDHVLQESTVDQYTNEYLLGMRSHFRYWGNRDVAYHILRTMLQPASTSEDEGVLDLKLSMPAPVTTSKGAKEAAQSKAKATARSRNGASGVVDQETKKQNRMSFTFSFFGGQSDSAAPTATEEDLMREQQQRRQQEEADEDLAMMDEEGELFGYRYSDLDMNHSANASSLSKATSATLFQNSPFASSAYASDLNSSGSNDDHGHRSTKRRISMQSTKSSGKTVSAATSSVAFEEGVVLVPDLARPAKLHHRSSRVEEKQ
ncbi:hypothetical protein BGZ70_010265 [Mortierella alpina]|uniref:DDHD domain-containing protein n=1 Tax=Mortierella alpina TaxID=64518 RepID=A0A9P6J1J8_MORAP|nr:hypothetical protein BGZ70_010265 [Mortierella alpina]